MALAAEAENLRDWGKPYPKAKNRFKVVTQTNRIGEMSGLQDAIELIEAYFQNGWTDGLPVIPPSETSINAMMTAIGLSAGEVVGEITARNVQITAEKVAINAVLAGCLPEYMPVVLAAVKGICHPDFGYHGAATSTGGAAIAIIVNGPVIQKLGINVRDNAFGPGFRPNATIGQGFAIVDDECHRYPARPIGSLDLRQPG